jgi:hypothetical protein
VDREEVEVAGDDRFGAAADGERDEVVVTVVAADRWVGARRIAQQGRLRGEIGYKPQGLVGGEVLPEAGGARARSRSLAAGAAR